MKRAIRYWIARGVNEDKPEHPVQMFLSAGGIFPGT